MIETITTDPGDMDLLDDGELPAGLTEDDEDKDLGDEDDEEDMDDEDDEEDDEDEA